MWQACPGPGPRLTRERRYGRTIRGATRWTLRTWATTSSGCSSPRSSSHARLDEIAAQIDADYAGKDLLLVGVLKGAVMVMADLARRLHSPVQMDWMAVSSYGSGTKSSGVVRILKDLDADLTGRHVLIVEDIIDSGPDAVLAAVQPALAAARPSVEIATMLRKPEAAKVEVDVRYVGFDIPNEFVVGYGLDYAEKYRNLPFVGTLAPHVYGA